MTYLSYSLALLTFSSSQIEKIQAILDICVEVVFQAFFGHLNFYYAICYNESKLRFWVQFGLILELLKSD